MTRDFIGNNWGSLVLIKLPLVGVNVFIPTKDGDTITSVINKPKSLCLKPTIYYCTSRLCELTAQLGGYCLIALIQLQSDLGWICTHWKLGWAERPKWALFFFFFKKIVFLKSYLFLIERTLLANIVLVFAVHQHESAIGTHMSSPSWNSLPQPTPPHPSRLSQSSSLSSLSHRANSHWLSVLHMVVYMCNHMFGTSVLFPCGPLGFLHGTSLFPRGRRKKIPLLLKAWSRA